MSRKKNRSQGTATTEKPASPPREIVLEAEASSPKSAPATRTAPPQIFTRAMRLLGSLYMAVILLSTAAVVLFLGSWLESKFDSKISQEFVYRTWWFTLLLFLFAINIFFAAAKKWPWKKHQTGFLITHVGLLTMLTGGMVTSFSNTDGQMSLIDTSDESIQDDNGFPQTGSEAVLADEAAIRVRNLTPG